MLPAVHQYRPGNELWSKLKAWDSRRCSHTIINFVIIITSYLGFAVMNKEMSFSADKKNSEHFTMDRSYFAWYFLCKPSDVVKWISIYKRILEYLPVLF